MWMHRRIEEPAPTSTACYWKKPPLAQAVTHVEYIKIKDLKNNSREVDVKDSSHFLDLVLKEMKERNHDCQLSRHFMVFDIKRTASVHQMMIEFCKGNSTDVTEFLKLASEILKPEICVLINKATVDQYKTHIWGEMRYGRATGSRIYEVAQCQTSSGSLVEEMIGVAKVRDNVAMERGKRLEKDVIAALEVFAKTKIYPSGLLLDAQYPILGASPDGVGKDFVIEIKCPASMSASSRYVNKSGKISIKYYGQLQLQMFMAKVQHGKFLVASRNFEKTKRFSLYDVPYDAIFTLNMIEKAMKFWKKNVFQIILNSV